MQAVDRHRKMVGKDDAQDKLIKYMYETKAGRVITFLSDKTMVVRSL